MLRTLESYLKFAYGSFLKPHSGDKSGNQQDALESFYEYQADAYDTTRNRLLRGRDDMIQLVAAQLKYKRFNHKPVWVDIGGGTGWNIEQMGKHMHMPSFFSTVYLVDLTPSLVKIAQARFDKLGWTNVKVIWMDCRFFDIRSFEASDSQGRSGADLITMSYSLTMIPDFFAVIDMTTSLLAPNGVIGVVDFYAQTEVEFMLRDHVGGFLDRHCSWLNRTFWRTWFEQDRVMFGGGRRDYLEDRFGTRLSINKRNAFLPGLRIPYYIWIGCLKTDSSTHLDASCVQTSFLPAPQGFKRPNVPLPSVYYQNCNWRTYYQNQVRSSKERRPTSIGPNVEDTKEVLRILSIEPNDVVLLPTRSGDAILSIAFQEPGSIHAVDPDASQNHLLELKLAAFLALNQKELHNLLGQGSNSSFRNVLLDKLSLYMSSQAFQYWLNYGSKGWLSNNNLTPKLERPSIIQSKEHTKLPLLNVFNRIRIHTADINDVLARTNPGSLTIVIVGNSFGFLNLEAEAHIYSLSRALAIKGRVLFESGAEKPSSIPTLEKLGFETERHGSKYWVCTKIRKS